MKALYNEDFAEASEPESVVPMAGAGAGARMLKRLAAPRGAAREAAQSISSTPAQVRERKIGDLFEYDIEHRVTIRQFFYVHRLRCRFGASPNDYPL